MKDESSASWYMRVSFPIESAFLVLILENFVTEHPMVHSAIMFGHGRYSAGILIQLKDGFNVDRDDPNQVEGAINQLR